MRCISIHIATCYLYNVIFKHGNSRSQCSFLHFTFAFGYSQISITITISKFHFVMWYYLLGLYLKKKLRIFGNVNLCWWINICIILVSMEKPLERVLFCMFRTHELGKTNYSPYLNKATLTMPKQINHKGLRSAKWKLIR